MIVLGITSVSLLFYFNHQRKKYFEAINQQFGSSGTPSIGGEFILTDQDGQTFDSNRLKGKYRLIYFGFTHCPDICPEELDKMSKVMKIMDEKGAKEAISPIFITCDPQRDHPAEIKEYLKGNTN